MKPDLSVVIPTRDRRIFVRKAVEYFERMNPKLNAELIIVDAGMWPLTEEDVRGHKLIRGILGSPIGPQLNLGIAEARAEFVLRQDDDDWYSPDWYASALETAASAPSGIAGVTDFYAYFPFRSVAWRWRCWGQPPEASHWSGGSMIFRKTIWEKSPFNYLKIGSDREFLLDAYRKLGLPPRTLVPDGTRKYVMIRHGLNLTGRYSDKFADAEAYAAVQEIMGRDMGFYEDLSDMVGVNELQIETIGDLVRKTEKRGLKPIGYFRIRV